MLKLMKYELRKTAFSKLVLLVITAVAEIAFLIGVFWKKDNILAMGIIFLVMCTIFGVIYIGIESVNVLHRDLNTNRVICYFSHQRAAIRFWEPRSWKMEFPLSWQAHFLQRWQPLM